MGNAGRFDAAGLSRLARRGRYTDGLCSAVAQPLLGCSLLLLAGWFLLQDIPGSFLCFCTSFWLAQELGQPFCMYENLLWLGANIIGRKNTIFMRMLYMGLGREWNMVGGVSCIRFLLTCFIWRKVFNVYD